MYRDACTGMGEWEESQSQVLRPVITEFGLSLRGVKDAERRASENPPPSQLAFPSALWRKKGS